MNNTYMHACLHHTYIHKYIYQVHPQAFEKGVHVYTISWGIKKKLTVKHNSLKTGGSIEPLRMGLYIHAYIHTCMHAYICLYVHTYICTYIYTYTLYIGHFMLLENFVSLAMECLHNTKFKYIKILYINQINN